MNPYFYINGSIVPSNEAKILVSDLGLLRGYGIFDYFRVINRKPFLINDYMERFYKSASLTGLKVPVTLDELKEIIQRLIIKNGVDNAGVKLMLTGGYSLNGYEPAQPNFFILYEASIPSVGYDYENGVKLITHYFQRDWPRIKSTNYFTAINLIPLIKQKNAVDVLYYKKGNVLESSRSNFFIVKNGVLITPVDNILLGITRKKVIELAKSKYLVEERTVPLSEVLEADEAFMTGSGRRIVPVVQIDEQTIGAGKPGPITKEIMAIFDACEEDFKKTDK